MPQVKSKRRKSIITTLLTLIAVGVMSVSVPSASATSGQKCVFGNGWSCVNVIGSGGYVSEIDFYGFTYSTNPKAFTYVDIYDTAGYISGWSDGKLYYGNPNGQGVPMPPSGNGRWISPHYLPDGDQVCVKWLGPASPSAIACATIHT